MLKTKLYSFQREGVRRLVEFDGRAILADEVGLGKTVQSLYYTWRYLPDDPAGPVVVVVPSHLKINWQREAQKHLGLRVEILSGQRPPPDKLPPVDPNQIFIINYDILAPPHWKAGTAPPTDSWLIWLTKLKPRMLICDEGQYAKQSSAARTRAVRYMAKRTPRVLILTGTPLANKPVDLYSLVQIVDPTIFPSKHDFLSRYSYYSKKWYGWVSKGARNLEELHRILSDTVMIRRRKQDVLEQLPHVQFTVIPIEVDLREYRKAEKDFIGWLAKKSPTMAANAAKAIEITKLNGLKQLAGQLKVDAVVRWSHDLLEETEGKLLLGAVHHSVTGPLMDAFGDKAVKVDGGLTHQQKQAAFDAFNLNPKCRVLVGNLQAAGTGWSCTATSDAALCELPWVPSEVEQFIGRLHGIERGIPGVVSHVRFLVAEDTIESDLCSLLQTKREWAAAAIDGIESPGGIDLHAEVRKLIQRRRG